MEAYAEQRRRQVFTVYYINVPGLYLYNNPDSVSGSVLDFVSDIVSVPYSVADSASNSVSDSVSGSIYFRIITEIFILIQIRVLIQISDRKIRIHPMIIRLKNKPEIKFIIILKL